MAHRIVPRDDGRWAIWSTAVDDFIMDEMTNEEVYVYFASQAYEQARQQAIDGMAIARDERECFDALPSPPPAHLRFHDWLTYDECVALREELRKANEADSGELRPKTNPLN